MSRVSLGQIENLEELVISLENTYQSAQQDCSELIRCVSHRLEQTQADLMQAQADLEQVQSAEEAAANDLQQAEADLSAAEYDLSSAESALSSCQSSGYVDQDGEYHEPQCDAEASAVSKAESAVMSAQNKMSTAESALNVAKQERMEAEKRAETAQRVNDMALTLAETTAKECAVRLSAIAELVGTAKTRLLSAQAALQAYLAANPSYASFYEWMKWQPSPNKPVTMAELSRRIKISPELQHFYLEYLYERSSEFRQKIEGYRQMLKSAQGSAERQAIQLKMRKNLSGYFTEKLVEQAFSPLGDVKTQQRTIFSDGRYTKTDLVIENLKVPVILGRGERMGAPSGGSIAIEVKSGQASYLYGQKDHMVFQAGGHSNADASITICTGDIKDLPEEQEEDLRQALCNAGSPLVGTLPRKSEIDRSCWDFLNQENEAEDHKEAGQENQSQEEEKETLE
ncbi:hypothetical protein [Mailhella sp.]